MLLKLLCILGILMIAGIALWILHAKLLLPIHGGDCETISIRVEAFGEAPELEMQLRGLLWMRNNGIIPCSIVVADAGLTPEASAAVRCFAAEKSIAVLDEKGTEIYGRNERFDGDQRQHCIDHLSE